jgi:hypothetical protein
MIPRRSGVIVNISSGSAIGPGAVPIRTRDRERAGAPATARRRPPSSASPKGSPQRCTRTGSPSPPWRRPRWFPPPAPCITAS